MFFDCKITLSIKEPGTQFCPVPQCPDPPRRHHRQLKRRHLSADEAGQVGVENGESAAADGQSGGIGRPMGGEQATGEEMAHSSLGEECISQLGLLTMVPLNVAMLAGALLLIRDAFKQFHHSD